MDRLPRLGRGKLICLLPFTCIYVVSVRGGFPVLWVLVIGCVILLWHSLGRPCNYLISNQYIRKLTLSFQPCTKAFIRRMTGLGFSLKLSETPLIEAAYTRVHKPTLIRDGGRYNLSHIWDRHSEICLSLIQSFF